MKIIVFIIGMLFLLSCATITGPVIVDISKKGDNRLSIHRCKIRISNPTAGIVTSKFVECEQKIIDLD